MAINGYRDILYKIGLAVKTIIDKNWFHNYGFGIHFFWQFLNEMCGFDVIDFLAFVAFENGVKIKSYYQSTGTPVIQTYMQKSLLNFQTHKSGLGGMRSRKVGTFA